MAGRPSIQFYFGDWKKNKKLRFCSWAARGAWIEVMGLMHDSEESTEYGVLRKPLRSIAQAIGAPVKLLQELATNGVMRGCASGLCEPLIYRPKSGRALGEPVTLIEAQQGPIWYSARMVVDEYVRLKRGDSSRFGDGLDASPKGGFGEGKGDAPKGPPNAAEGDGASTSSSSSSKSFSHSPGASAHEADPPAVVVTDAEGNPLNSVIAELTPAQSAAVVKACIALRKMGAPPRIHPGDEVLAALAAEGFTAEHVVRVVGEKALRDAGLLNDPDVRDDLAEVFINGGSQTDMGLTGPQHTALRGAVAQVSMGYIAATLRGRRRDAAAGDNPPAARRRKPSATDNFEGKTYVGTPVEQLPPELRAAVEQQLG
jgi:hypothetical protein